MKDYKYALIRFVKDRERMEPINVGVVLQGDGRVDFKLNAHLSKKKAVPKEAWHRWRKFFEEEVRGTAVPLFQPDRSKMPFLRYLAGICQENVLLSSPLAISVEEERAFDAVLDSLYSRLVAQPEEAEDKDAQRRPTARFRTISEERRFERRGMKKDAFVHVGGRPLWPSYRQILNGEVIAIEKIEVNRSLHLTALEVQKLPGIQEVLPLFLKGTSDTPSRFVLLADELEKPFGEQPESEFHTLRDVIERSVDRVVKVGGTVIRDTQFVEAFAVEMEGKLQPTSADFDAD